MGALYAVLAVGSLRGKSVTADEFGHLPAGYNLLRTGEFGYCELNPPLANALSALPVVVMGPRATGPELSVPEEYAHSFWVNGYAFMSRYWGDYHALFVAARCVTVVLVGLLGLLLFGWARVLVPERADAAGLMAAALVWFSPNVMAHARLVTTDAGVALFVTAALCCFHLFLRRPSGGRVVLAGVSLGLAQLAKFSAVYLYPVVVVLAVVWRVGERGAAGRRLWGGLAAALAISLATVNAGYLFGGSGRGLGAFELSSEGLRGVQGVLPGWLPVPLPADYVLAFDRQARDAEAGDPSYLLGESYRGGRWYYYLVLLAVKTPLPGLLLVGLAVGVAIVWRVRPSFRDAMLLLPAGLFVLVFSVLSNKQLGLRMILPAAPLVWLWVATTLASVAGRPGRLEAAWLGLVGWMAAVTVGAYPHYLPHFNVLAGGPSRGHRYALDSNLDWGQDLIGLKRYMDQHGLESIQLLYFGRVQPELYGIRYEVPLEGFRPGYLAVGLSLTGRSYVINDHGRLLRAGPVVLDPAVVGAPVASVGHSILIYQVAPGGKPQPEEQARSGARNRPGKYSRRRGSR